MFQLQMKNLFLKANLLALVLVAALPGAASSINSDAERKLAWTGIEYDTPPDNLPEGWNTIVSDYSCRFSNCCEQCEGSCYIDDDCRGPDSPLVCHLREWDGPVPGCIGSSNNGWGYCIHPAGGYVVPDPTLDPKHLLIRTEKCTESNPCVRKCEGACTTDDQCTGTKACYILGNETVKDCDEHTGTEGVGYCGGVRPAPRPTGSPTVSLAPTMTESPSWHPRESYGMLILIDECPSEGCPVCSGKTGTNGCEVDSDCAAGLKCLQRGHKSVISGCSESGISGANYCYAPDYDYLPPVLVQPVPQSEKEGYFYQEADLPERCELFAASVDEKTDIPFAGESGIGEARRHYGEITYIYLMDYSKSTILGGSQGACGDTHKEYQKDLVIDCEVAALDAVNTATLQSGNVDLVGLVRFDSTAKVLQDLVTPWYQEGNYSRDASIIQQARASYPSGATNFQAGIEEACHMARSPLNTNSQTVIIMISDGLPNKGTSAEDTIKNNCNGAKIMTFAATAAAECDKTDNLENMEAGADPDTLEEIARFGGGTCTHVPDVTKLPGILIQLDETTWGGVRITVNGNLASDASVNYTDTPGFRGPKNTTYTGTVSLGPGEYELCMEASSSTSGISEYDVKCTNIEIVNTAIEPATQVMSASDDETAEFKVSITSLGTKPGCGNLSGKQVDIRDCEGTVIETVVTDANGEVAFNFTSATNMARTECYEACFTDTNGNDACTKTIIEWQDSPSLSPSVSPSMGPSSYKSSNSPSTAPSIMPSKSPTRIPTSNPSYSPSDSPSVLPTTLPSMSPSNRPSALRSGVPSPSPSERPSPLASDGPSGAPSRAPSGSPSTMSVVVSETPSDAPITSAPTTDAPVTTTPTTDAPSIQTVTTSPSTDLPSSMPSVSLSPSATPSRPPSPYCNALENDTCTLCEAFRSPDYCDPSDSFASLVSARTAKFRKEADTVTNDGYWFHSLEDKIAGYLLTLDSKLMAPQIYCCTTNVTGLAECLESSGFKTKGVDGGLTIESGSGIVIKATNFHSNQGVFILVNNTSLQEGEVLDLHQNNAVTFTDVITGLNDMQASKIIVEEFIGDDLPVEYKIHVINGKVQAIDIIQDRGHECGCYAVVDTDFNRLDYHGCFEPGGTGYSDPTNPECVAIDFETGQMRAGPVKKDMYLCNHVTKPDQCVIDDMIAMAEILGNRIGVAMRVDMFVSTDNTVYVQEYSPNPMNGLRHCAAKVDENGCVDSCFLGREWKAAGGIYGGSQTDVPKTLEGFLGMNDADQCAMINGAFVDNAFPPSCLVGPSA